jgi:DNA-binding FrmR family transcriptional regulator
MLNEDRDFPEILTQIFSARRGLKSLAEKLRHSHAHHCIKEAQDPAEGRTKLRELIMVLERDVE